MVDRHQYDKVLEQLSTGGSSIRCQELADKLISLGFEVRDGKKAGHKVFVHHGMESFTSGGYTCGHGRNPEIKPVYIKKVAKLLRQYETELIQYLGEQS
ncbi:MAG: type II toxin-antitoxin system HicA family toxin [Candidatus Thiodiazotropha sp.]